MKPANASCLFFFFSLAGVFVPMKLKLQGSPSALQVLWLFPEITAKVSPLLDYQLYLPISLSHADSPEQEEQQRSSIAMIACLPFFILSFHAICTALHVFFSEEECFCYSLLQRNQVSNRLIEQIFVNRTYLPSTG